MITRKDFLRIAGMAGMSTALRPWRAFADDPPKARPNIVWLSCEDIGPHLGCYGDAYAHTPALDRLAAEGVRYTNAFTTAGVCAPTRSGIITGMYATTLGTHHMRSGGEGTGRSVKPERPPEVRCFSEYLRDAGYYCTNNVKEDYNFAKTSKVWDESSGKAHWRNRPDPKQPFFAVFNYTGTHEGSVGLSPKDHAQRTHRLTPGQRQDAQRITPPPFHPDTSVVRGKWADYHELITALDYWIADQLEDLEDDGLADNTIVFFWSDHGAGLPRCKRWVYESGTHVPLIVRIPERWRVAGQGAPGAVDNRLVSSIDFSATVLNLVGLPVPGYMQGRAFLGPEPPPERIYVYAARDRMDERYDIIRMVRDKRYRYIRNYEPFKPYDQYMNTAEKSTVKVELHRLAKEGGLPPAAAWVAAGSKPVEELYDTQADPHEVHNLADNPDYGPVLERLRKAHEAWMRETGDLGLIPEPELAVLEKTCGRRFGILARLEREDPSFRETLRSVAVTAGRPAKEDLPALLDAAKSEQPAIRYWAVTGLGNLDEPQDSSVRSLTTAIEDASPTVRVAAAKALLRLARQEGAALAVLMKELESPQEWVRLHTATALDGIGERARPAIPLLKQALKDTDNKYVVRVANHALNELLGIHNQVR